MGFGFGTKDDKASKASKAGKASKMSSAKAADSKAVKAASATSKGSKAASSSVKGSKSAKEAKAGKSAKASASTTSKNAKSSTSKGAAKASASKDAAKASASKGTAKASASKGAAKASASKGAAKASKSAGKKGGKADSASASAKELAVVEASDKEKIKAAKLLTKDDFTALMEAAVLFEADGDGDGTVSLPELCTLLVSHTGMAESDAAKKFKEYDLDGDSQLSLDEFLRFLYAEHMLLSEAGSSLTAGKLALFASAFAEFDIDENTGMLRLAGFADAAAAFFSEKELKKRDLSVDGVKAVMAELDLSGDELTFAQFVSVLLALKVDTDTARAAMVDAGVQAGAASSADGGSSAPPSAAESSAPASSAASSDGGGDGGALAATVDVSLPSSKKDLQKAAKDLRIEDFKIMLLAAVFFQADGDGDGTVNQEELVDFLTKDHIGLSEDEAKEAFAAFDIDGDARLALGEFLKLLATLESSEEMAELTPAKIALVLSAMENFDADNSKSISAAEFGDAARAMFTAKELKSVELSEEGLAEFYDTLAIEPGRDMSFAEFLFAIVALKFGIEIMQELAEDLDYRPDDASANSDSAGSDDS